MSQKCEECMYVCRNDTERENGLSGTKNSREFGIFSLMAFSWELEHSAAT